MQRGIRGAITVPINDAESIIEATKQLLRRIQEANQLEPENIGAIFFTVTPDLDAAFPAKAARELGWQHVPLLDMQQAKSPTDLSRCIRVMVLAETDLKQTEIQHIYEGEARCLRPDLLREDIG